jgi:glycosyltransferase involved in cell wall biosynthesis
MKFLWSIHLYPPAHNCGSEYVAHMVNKYLISKGHHCRVILHYYKDQPYNYEGVEVFPATGYVDAYRWCDVMLTHLDMTQFSIIMAHETKKPIVHFVHNDIPYSSIINSFGNVSAIYNSDWIKESIGYNIPGCVLHPPCDIKDYKVDSSREFITLISLNERKGGYLFYQIAKAMPERKFLGVVGSYDNPGKENRKQIDIINELLQLPNFTLVPNTPDILSTYKMTRILLMPSDYESWGRTATEAMCSGIPIICTPTPGLKENCGKAAIYVGKQSKGEPGEPQVEVGSVEEWVRAIKRLDSKKEYEKYSVLCRQRAEALNPAGELENLEQFLINVARPH